MTFTKEAEQSPVSEAFAVACRHQKRLIILYDTNSAGVQEESSRRRKMRRDTALETSLWRYVYSIYAKEFRA